MSTKYREKFEQLSERFHPKDLKTRAAGGGRNLTYITARQAMNRFDEVMGPENWKMKYRLEAMVEGISLVVCTISLRCGEEWIDREDSGGFKEMTERTRDGKTVTDKENTVKTGYSDAFKRAASAWGVGRYLYNDGDPIYQDELPPEEANQLPPPTLPATPPPASGISIKGLYTEEHKKRTVKFMEFIDKSCSKVNETWKQEWEARAERWMADGLDVPAEMPELINSFKARGHLLKWAKEAKRIDPAIIPEDLKPQQSQAVLAVVYFDDQHKAALRGEFVAYVDRLKALETAAFYRKWPALAPTGHAEEMAEAEDRGDAWEPEATLANAGGNN